MLEERQGTMYRIGMFSKLGRVTVKTLHHYDEVGLLAPATIDEENGYRYYTASQLSELNTIVALRQMGFSVPEVSAIVAGHNVAGIISERKTELETTVQNVTDQLLRLNNYINEQKEGRAMDYQAVIKNIPATTVVSVLHKGSYEKLGEAYAYALQWVEQNNYRITDNIRESYIDGI